MRVAFCLFKYFPFGGLQNDFMDVAGICVERGHEVFAYACDWQGEIPPDFTVRQMECRAHANHVKYRRYYQQVSACLQPDRIDCVVGFNKMPGLDVYFASDPSYRARKRNFLERLTPRYRHFSQYEAAVFTKTAATRILILSAAQQHEYQQAWGTPDERFIAMPPGIHREARANEDAARRRQQVRAELDVKDEDLLLLMIGSGFRTKGLDRALQAMKELPEELLGRTQLVAIGQDKAAPFDKMANDMGLGARVRILPGRPDIPAVMQAGDLLIHPAYREVAGKVILEAVVSGLPVLVTDVCGYAHHVDKAGAGTVLQSPFDQNVMNRQLQQMLLQIDASRKNREERSNWRDRGIEYGQTQDLYNMAAAAADAIESCCAEKIAQHEVAS